MVSNAFLAQRVSSINAISALCEKTEADVTEVARAVGADSRIGSRFLNASIGFGGSCFKKDILNLVYLCRHYGLNDVADYWESVIKINNYQQERFVRNMLAAMFNTLAGKRICLFGSPSRPIRATRGKARPFTSPAGCWKNTPKSSLRTPRRLTRPNRSGQCPGQGPVCGRPLRGRYGCHAIAVMTEWPLYADLDYERLYRDAEKPALFLTAGTFWIPDVALRWGSMCFP
jgi:UDPglucose 6-dehydrogenase